MRKLMSKQLLLALSLFLIKGSVPAQSKINPEKGYISIDMPRTPESQSFEKYGNIPVDEYSGVPNISIPLGSVRSKFLEAPITLSYHASGIKVNQEASWVGLGWDLNCGGRISVEIKGNADEIMRQSISSTSTFKDGMRRMFNKWSRQYGPYQNQLNNAPKTGYAYIDYGKELGNYFPSYHTGDTSWDDNYMVTRAAWEGAAEPDIYHANFMGNSLNFYIDIITDKVMFIGEKNRFHVAVMRTNDIISSIIITDNAGVQYYFEQKEITRSTMPSGQTLFWYTESPTAWLLTKVKRQDDLLTFSYTNFGETKPAYTWAQSISGTMPNMLAQPSDPRQNEIKQYPYYLSKVESNTTVADFSFGSRTDLDGAGARKLEKIEIKDKVTGNIVKRYNFNYDYFTASAVTSDNTLPDIQKKRLKLLSIDQGSNDAPWKFYYNATPGPSKYSFSQDHWGYYNGAANENLIPRYAGLGSLVNRNIGWYYRSTNEPSSPSPTYDVEMNNTTVPESFQGRAWDGRNCDPDKILAYTLETVTYPTGGSSKFSFEPHVSNYQKKQIVNFVGGGLRVKNIKHYSADNVLESTEEYDYQNSGVFLGAIEYLRAWTKYPAGNSIVLSAWGNLNTGGQDVGYASVKKTVKDYLNVANNGYTINYYTVNNPLYAEAIYGGSPFYLNSQPGSDPAYLFIHVPRNEPTQKNYLDGKVYKKVVYNAQNTLVKQQDFTYRQAEFSNNYYSIRVEDDYSGKENVVSYPHDPSGCLNCWDEGCGYITPMNWRRWAVTLYPAMSYYTVLDELTEKTLAENGNYVTTKQTFKYNPFQQQEYAATYNSDGTQNINYTITPLSLHNPAEELRYHPSLPPGTFANGINEALSVERMKSIHVYDVPIEQISLKRSASGDTTVLASTYSLYDWMTYKKAYAIEINQPLLLRTQFNPAHNIPSGSTIDLERDSRYKLQETAEHTTSNLVKDLASTKIKKSFIWDEDNNTILASVINASSADIAFTSFETAAKGGWSYSGTATPDNNAPAGKMTYNLSSGNITSAVLDNTKTYIVSYWSKNGPQSAGFSMGVAGRTLNGYTLYEHRIANPSSITVSGSGTIDELRLYPASALMTSYTYQPLTGISSQNDPNNRISYYSYDGMNRLVAIRDQDKNVLKTFCYNYAGQPEDCHVCINKEADWQNTLTPLRCQQSSPCVYTGYQEQEQKDMNSCSPTYNQTRWVQGFYNTTACPAGSAIPITYSNPQWQTGFTITYTNTTTNATFSFPIPNGSGTLGCVPAGTYTIQVSKPGNTTTMTFNIGCSVISGTLASFRRVIVNAQGCNSITITQTVEQ